MRFISRLYWGSTAGADKDNILRMLGRRSFCPGIYVITEAVDSDGLLDILPAGQMTKKRVLETDPLIFGIAAGRDEAFELARCIIDDVYRRKGDFDLNAFCDAGNS